MLVMETVALKPVAVEARYAGSAKQESGLAFRTFNISKPRRSFLLVSFGHHANSTCGENPDTPPVPYDLAERRSRSGINQQKSRINVTGTAGGFFSCSRSGD